VCHSVLSGSGVSRQYQSHTTLMPLPSFGVKVTAGSSGHRASLPTDLSLIQAALGLAEVSLASWLAPLASMLPPHVWRPCPSMAGLVFIRLGALGWLEHQHNGSGVLEVPERERARTNTPTERSRRGVTSRINC
jgi:hypothetical protein